MKNSIKKIFNAICESFIDKYVKVEYRLRESVSKRPEKVYKIYKFLFIKITMSQPLIWGDNNHVYMQEDDELRELTTKELFLYNIKIKGNNNKIILPEKNNPLKYGIEILGNNNKVTLKGSQIPSYVWISFFCSENSEVFIDNVYLIGECAIALAEGNELVKIGRDCMISADIKIFPTDCHPIYDLNTKERVNLAKPVIIGEHVWIGRGVRLLKGSNIPDGCVVGLNSMVTKAFHEKNSIIAGSPAKVIKRNVYWDKSFIDENGQKSHDCRERERERERGVFLIVKNISKAA